MARLTMSHGGDRHSDIVLRGTPGKLKIFSIHYVAQSAHFPDVQQTSLLFRYLKRDFIAVPERVGHSSGYSRVAHKHKRRIAEYDDVDNAKRSLMHPSTFVSCTRPTSPPNEHERPKKSCFTDLKSLPSSDWTSLLFQNGSQFRRVHKRRRIAEYAGISILPQRTTTHK